MFVLKKLSNFRVTAYVSGRKSRFRGRTRGTHGGVVIRIHQPKNGELHEAVKVVSTPLGDGWYETVVYINEKAEVWYESNEKHEITHTHTSEGFRRNQ